MVIGGYVGLSLLVFLGFDCLLLLALTWVCLLFTYYVGLGALFVFGLLSICGDLWLFVLCVRLVLHFNYAACALWVLCLIVVCAILMCLWVGLQLICSLLWFNVVDLFVGFNLLFHGLFAV